jgi:hypothetical protein
MTTGQGGIRVYWKKHEGGVLSLYVNEEDIDKHTIAVLSQEQEQKAVDAITALDWDTDTVAPASRAIAGALSMTEDYAITVLLDLSKRGLIHQRPERPANNFADTGIKSEPTRSKQQVVQGPVLISSRGFADMD